MVNKRRKAVPPQAALARISGELCDALFENLLLQQAERRLLASQIQNKLEQAWRVVDPAIEDDVKALEEAAAVLKSDPSLLADLEDIRRAALIRHWLVVAGAAITWAIGMLGYMAFLQPEELSHPFTLAELPPEPLIAALLIGLLTGMIVAGKGWFFGGVSVVGGLILMMLFKRQIFYGSMEYLMVFLPLVIFSGIMGGYAADLLSGRA